MLRYPFLDLKDATEAVKQQLIDAASEIIAGGQYVGGEPVKRFENDLAQLVGVSHVVGVSNGLDALRLSLRAAIIAGRLHPGDRVAVAANTYIASVLAITDCGLSPLLVDPDPVTMNLSAEGLRRSLTPDTKGVMLVHLYGRTDWDAELRSVIVDNNLFVIEDVAQAIGAIASVRGLHATTPAPAAGALGDIAAFSFYPTKNVGALGDAGAVATADGNLAEIVRALANYGSTRRYHNTYQGFNCRLDTLQAAFLSIQLSRVDQLNQRRRARAELYGRLIVNPQVVKPMIPVCGGEMVWHQYVVRHDSRQKFRDYLTSAGVGTDIHYATPPHLQPCYAGLQHGNLPTTEQLADTVLSLPVSDTTSLDDVAAISEIINSSPIF